ncbi:flavodoxin domain-containing protein [Thermodesulfobacteriota bacterium]
MKSIIIYFSLTGSTKKVALAIHKGMSQVADQCDIATVKEVEDKEFDIQRLIDYDLIGVGSPVWGIPIPQNFKDMIESMPQLKDKHAFAFCTHGCAPAYFFPQVVRFLARRGLKVIATRDWYGSLYLPVAPKPYLTDGHPDNIDLMEAEHFGREIVELSRRVSAGETQLIPPLPPMPPKLKSSRQIKRFLPQFNLQKCRYPECRLCVDNCPLNVINLSVSPPVVSKNCRFCYFCELICPEGAVEVDYENMIKGFSSTVEERFIERMDQAEAEGTFRRLVPLKDVGWDTPFFKVYNKHPRYIIPEE